MLCTTVSRMTLWQEISKYLVELSTAVGDVDRRFEQISGKFGGRLMFSLANSSITLLINVAAWLVDVGKISGDRAESVGWIVYHSPCLQNSNLVNFYGFTTSIPVNRRLPVIVSDFCTIRETPLRKKINFFPPGVFGPPEYLGPRSTSDYPTSQFAPVHACFWSLLFFLFFVMEARYFPLSPQAAIFLVTPLGLGLPDPNPNPKPNPKCKLHFKTLPLPIIESWAIEMGVDKSTT